MDEELWEQLVIEVVCNLMEVRAQRGWVTEVRRWLRAPERARDGGIEFVRAVRREL